MQIRDITRLIEDVAPAAVAEQWDNVGLQVGSLDAETNACLLSLDVTPDVIREAKQCAAGLVIAHHPLILKPLPAVTDDSVAGATVLAAARLNVAVCIAHTNLDNCAQLGTARALADQLGLQPGRVLAPIQLAAELRSAAAPTREGPGPVSTETDTDLSETPDGKEAVEGERYGRGLLCEVPPMRLHALAQYAANRLGRKRCQVVGDSERTVTRVALAPGSGASLIAQAAVTADVIITGELKYHEAQWAQNLGLAAIALGHYATERPVLDSLARYLKNAAKGALQVAISRLSTDPFWDVGD